MEKARASGVDKSRPSARLDGTGFPVSDEEKDLFSPVRLGPIRLANRIVMAPMTRRKSPAGVPGPNVAAYYARHARGGVGLICSLES